MFVVGCINVFDYLGPSPPFPLGYQQYQKEDLTTRMTAKKKKQRIPTPQNPDPSRKIVGLMIETSHPRKRIVGEISFLGHTNGS